MKRLYLYIVAMAAVFLACFPQKTAHNFPVEQLAEQSYTVRMKAVLKDGSVMLFDNGFNVRPDTLWGIAQRFRIDTPDDENVDILTYNIPLDSVAAMTYYTGQHTAGEVLGSVVSGLYASLSGYCVLCPKCCFGSCPTLYSEGAAGYDLEAELFSYSISPFFQDADMDCLTQAPAADGRLRLRVANEALETHYLNRFTLMATQHPPDLSLYPTADNGVLAVRELQTPAAFDAKGRDVQDAIRDRDGESFRSDPDRIRSLSVANHMDEITLAIPVEDSAQSLKLVLRLRNTLLSTILFYDVVLGSQGIDAIQWTERMCSDSAYAAWFYRIYRQYAGLQVAVEGENGWEVRARTGDVGPIAWKTLGIRVPIKPGEQREGQSVRLKLQFFTDNFMIDYAGYEWDDGNMPDVALIPLQPRLISDDEGLPRGDVAALLGEFDDRMLVTQPGQSFYFDYRVPTASGQNATTLFLYSQGYYIEWLRGSWITDQNRRNPFSLMEISRVFAQLKSGWLDSRETLESVFFKSRISLKEAL